MKYKINAFFIPLLTFCLLFFIGSCSYFANESSTSSIETSEATTAAANAMTKIIIEIIESIPSEPYSPSNYTKDYDDAPYTEPVSVSTEGECSEGGTYTNDGWYMLAQQSEAEFKLLRMKIQLEGCIEDDFIFSGPFYITATSYRNLEISILSEDNSVSDIYTGTSAQLAYMVLAADEVGGAIQTPVISEAKIEVSNILESCAADEFGQLTCGPSVIFDRLCPSTANCSNDEECMEVTDIEAVDGTFGLEYEEREYHCFKGCCVPGEPERLFDPSVDPLLFPNCEDNYSTDKKSCTAGSFCDHVGTCSGLLCLKDDDCIGNMQCLSYNMASTQEWSYPAPPTVLFSKFGLKPADNVGLCFNVMPFENCGDEIDNQVPVAVVNGGAVASIGVEDGWLGAVDCEDRDCVDNYDLCRCDGLPSCSNAADFAQIQSFNVNEDGDEACAIYGASEQQVPWIYCDEANNCCVEKSCTDSIDDDGNELIDCDDPLCSQHPTCLP